ncbi:MAG TPA: polysaccharide biosynthesis C-terminal domain-containing protein [Bacteroidales bacterium]|nr:polysaccharide biosynthesis C-terminal domain-containing protein [Bacteroidales bacterium]
MKKKFLINLILLVILNLLVKPFWVFGIDRTVQNLVGSAEYGMLFALFNISVIFNILLDLGITNFNNRHISQRPEAFSSVFPRIIGIKLALAFIYALVVLSAGLIIGYEKRQMLLMLLLITNQFVVSFTLYLRSNISGLQYYTTDSILSVSDRIIMITACIVAYYAHFKGTTITIEWFVLIQTFSYVLSAFIVLSVLLSKTGLKKIKFGTAINWDIVKAGLPYALLIFLMSMYSRIDSIMLERLLPDGKEQAGIYAQSFRILDSVVMMPILFAGLLLPMFSKLLGSKENVAPLLNLAFKLSWVIAVAFSLAAGYYSRPIIDMLYNHGSMYSARVFTILTFSFIPVSVVYIYSTLITASGSLKWLNIVSLISVCINIALNIVLIPHYKAIGAAIACLITQTIAAIAQILLVKNQFQTVFASFKKFAFFTLMALVLAHILYIVVSDWIFGFLAIGLAIAFLGFITKMIPFKNITRLLIPADFKKEGNCS